MELTHINVIFILFVCFVCHINSGDVERIDKDSSKILSRRRRFVTFPEGAIFSSAFCLTVGVLGQPSKGIYTWGLNWGISYELPNQTQILDAVKKIKKIPRPIVTRRSRRDLYSKIESIFNDMGYRGRDCIYRALCEAAQNLMPRGETIVEELFRTVFTLPKTGVLPSEPIEHHLYDAAQKEGLQQTDCANKYWLCPVSLLDLALGYYSPFIDQNSII